MPISNLVRALFFSVFASVTFRLRASSNNFLKSNRIDRGLRLAPLGLPLRPGGHWYSFGGRPGPTLYSASFAGVSGTGEGSEFFRPLLELDGEFCVMVASSRNGVEVGVSTSRSVRRDCAGAFADVRPQSG